MHIICSHAWVKAHACPLIAYLLLLFSYRPYYALDTVFQYIITSGSQNAFTCAITLYLQNTIMDTGRDTSILSFI